MWLVLCSFRGTVPVLEVLMVYSLCMYPRVMAVQSIGNSPKA